MKNNLFTIGRKYAGAKINTVFLGGGTPSLVPANIMSGVLDALRSSFDILPDAEFTSEANPGTLTKEWLDMAMERGLNRLSLGVQAAQDSLLKTIGRIHSFEEAKQAVHLAKACGIRNLNLDAMFGLPGQTRQDYLDTLQAFVDLEPQHISAYSLILEEGTPLHKAVEEGSIVLPSEDETAQMYEDGIDFLAKAGFERYEVSNFARPGHACRHNIGYWQGAWYLGMGVAAHSMLPPDEAQRAQGAVRVRVANDTDVHSYINGTCTQETQLILPEEAMFESMMLGLRTTQGVNEALFAHKHGQALRSRYGVRLDSLVRDGLAVWKDGCFALTPRGIAIENEVLMRLMD